MRTLTQSLTLTSVAMTIRSLWTLVNNGVTSYYQERSTNNAVLAGAAVATVPAGVSASYAGVLSGGGGLTVQGGGMLTLLSVNTYTGGTTINAGTLRLNNVPCALGTVTIASGAVLEYVAPSGLLIQGSGGSLTVSGSGTFRKSGAGLLQGGPNGSGNLALMMNMTGGLIDVTGGQLTSNYYGLRFASTNKAILNLATGANLGIDGGITGGDVWIDALTGSGSIQSPHEHTTLQIGNNNGSGIFSGQIGNPGGTSGGGGGQWKIVKNGTGTQTFNGPNSFTGTVTINAGTLVQSYSWPGGNISVNSGGTLTYTVNTTGTRTATVNAGGVINKGGFAHTGTTFINNGGTINP